MSDDEKLVFEKVNVDKDAEIAHLKDLLAFATRPHAPTSLLRFEVSVELDDATMRQRIVVCVTCPGADEQRIAALATERVAEIWNNLGDVAALDEELDKYKKAFGELP